MENGKIDYNIPGVYILFSNTEIVYIGTTWSFGIRVTDHRCLKEFFKLGYLVTHGVFIECNEERFELEIALIHFYKPIGNIKQFPINQRYLELEEKYNKLLQSSGWTSNWS